jgi:hypothetical protein
MIERRHEIRKHPKRGRHLPDFFLEDTPSLINVWEQSSVSGIPNGLSSQRLEFTSASMAES